MRRRDPHLERLPGDVPQEQPGRSEGVPADLPRPRHRSLRHPGLLIDHPMGTFICICSGHGVALCLIPAPYTRSYTGSARTRARHPFIHLLASCWVSHPLTCSAHLFARSILHPFVCPWAPHAGSYAARPSAHLLDLLVHLPLGSRSPTSFARPPATLLVHLSDCRLACPPIAAAPCRQAVVGQLQEVGQAPVPP